MTGVLPESGRGIIQPTLSNDMRETPASVGVFLCPAVLAAAEPCDVTAQFYVVNKICRIFGRSLPGYARSTQPRSRLSTRILFNYAHLPPLLARPDPTLCSIFTMQGDDITRAFAINRPIVSGRLPIKKKRNRNHLIISSVLLYFVAEGGFEPPTFGL